MLETVTLENKNVSLIDADSILYIVSWKDKEYVEDLDELYNSADRLITNLLLSTKATHYLGFFSVGTSFRKKEYESYKSNRDNIKRPPYLKETRKHIVDKWFFNEITYYEADDAVSICSNVIPNNIVCSIDKDVLMLYGRNYNYKKNTENFTTKEEESLFFWRSMITGDTVDGIKGIPNKGKVFAEKTLTSNTYETFSSIVLQLYIENFGEYQGIYEYYKNYKLLKILERDETFESTYKHLIDNPFKVDTNKLVI